jgi:polar amino acid transport system substrate-binding protein
MKVISLSRLILWFCCCSLLGISMQANACEMKFRVQAYPPFAMQGSQGGWHGLDLDYANALLKQANCDIKTIHAPWGRGLELLKTGGIDLMVNVSKNPEREKHFHFVGPQRLENIRLLGKKGAGEPIDSWAKLAAAKGTFMRQIGSYFGERFELTMGKGSAFAGQLVELPNNQIRLALLERGRVSGFFSEDIYANYVRSKMEKPGELYKHPLVIHSNPVYYAFSKASVDEKQIKHLRKAFKVLSQTEHFKKLNSSKK